jgi:GDPmannose 4,6-dehydratase
MHKMLQQEVSDDYVIGTGETHTVYEFLEEAFKYADLDLRYLRIDDPGEMRPTEVNELRADTTKARAELGWEPKIKMKELVRIMVDADMRAQGLAPHGDGDALVHRHFPHKWWQGD